MEKQIIDPPVPYVGPIYGGTFCPGKMLRIMGIIPGFAYRFNISLQCGPETSPRDDVALQISVRMLEGHILLNSLYNGVWGDEQRDTAIPFKRSEKFEIILMCDFDQYRVAINGQHYCEFPHRIPCDDVTHLAIDGDVSVIQISYASVLEGEMEGDDFDLEDAIGKPFPPGLHPPPPGLKPLSTDIFLDDIINDDQRLCQEPFEITPRFVTTAPHIAVPETDSLNSAEEAINSTVVPEITSFKYASPNKPNPFDEVLLTFETVDRYYWHKCCAAFWAVILSIIIIFVIVVTQADKRIIRMHSNSTFNGSNNTETNLTVMQSTPCTEESSSNASLCLLQFLNFGP